MLAIRECNASARRIMSVFKIEVLGDANKINKVQGNRGRKLVLTKVFTKVVPVAGRYFRRLPAPRHKRSTPASRVAKYH